MDRQKMISNLKQNFMLKRIHAQQECEDFINSLKSNPEFDKLYSEYTKKQIEYTRSQFEEESLSLKHDVQDLKDKINAYLKAHDIDASRLSPKYDCPLCNDTGVVGGRICKCLLNELNKTISINSSSQSEFKNFSSSDDSSLTANDKKAYEVIKSWCDKFPDITKININIMGGAGSGKTFLLECVANEMLNKNLVVVYKTAFELNELARLYHIGKSYEFGDILNADILLIDDLGTEPVLKNITNEYLYNLINTRQIHKKPTFISTNLSLDNILSRYDERIFSRLANKSLAITINLTSADKRIR